MSNTKIELPVITISHSAAQDLKTCKELNYLKRVAKIRPKKKGASLYFGIAIDNAITHLLEQKRVGNEITDYNIIHDLFLNGKQGWETAKDNPAVVYRDADYDAKGLEPEDLKELKKHEKRLKTTVSDSMKAYRQRKYKPLKDNENEMVNIACWFSMRRKGDILIDAFIRDILPNIKKVIATQHKIQGMIGGIAKVVGYIDLICEYEGFDKPVVLDLKTAASKYDDNAVQFGEQLVLYLNAVGEELGTNLVGYAVLLKNLKTDSVCSACGTEKTTSHRTCNNEVDGARCNAEWTNSKPYSETQVMIEEISDRRKKMFLDSFENLAIEASQGLRIQNWNSCFNYGMCDYFHLCHFGDESHYDIPENYKKEEK